MNEILYGKGQIKNIVNLEVNDSSTELFIQDQNGSISSQIVLNRFWLLSVQSLNGFKQLKGSLFYNYGKQFDNRNDFLKARSYLKHNDLFSIYNEKESYMVLKGETYYKGLRPQDVSILSFDLETTGLEHNDKSAILIISNTFRKNSKIVRKLFCYDEFNDQGEMIQAWCKWVCEMNPSIITGHNLNLFDIHYLQFITDKFDTPLKLGRNGSNLKVENYESKFRKDGSQFYHYHKSKIYGREIVDTLFLALKYDVGRKYESYGLKQIIKQEGLEVKNRQFYDASKIKDNYKDPIEWQKIKDYAMFDADDALALFDLMSPPLFYSAQIIPKSFQLITESAEGSKINSIMMRSYLQNGHSLPKASEAEKFEGAISIGNPGIYRNVFKVDVSSLYPSIMIQYEVYDKEKDPNGNFLELVKDLTAQRLKNKQLAKETNDPYYKGLEQSQKILINSAYGFLGSNGLLFNSPLKAALITEKGREILNKSMEWAKNSNLSLVNADTDSISFNKSDSSFIEKEERKSLLNELNSLFPEKIKFEDDGFYKCIIVIKAKNYIMQKEDGSIIYKGSAIKASNKSPALKQFIKDIIEAILNNKNNYLEIYNNYAKEIQNITDIKRWATKKTVTQKVLEGTRLNETKVKDAINDSDYAEGDKIWVYYNENNELILIENFKNDYSKKRLLKALHDTSKVFNTIIDKNQFLNYTLVKNEELVNKL